MELVCPTPERKKPRVFTRRGRLAVLFCVSHQGGRSPKQPHYGYRKVGGRYRGGGAHIKKIAL